MRAIKLSMLVLTLAAGITTQAQTADEIMTKRNAAMNVDAWKNVKSMKMDITTNQQGMDIAITYTVLLDKSLARMDLSVMGMSGFQILNGNQGWSYMPFMGSDKIDTLKKEQVDQMKEQIDFKGKQVLDYKSTGGKADLTGKDTINGTMCYKVKITEKDGDEHTHYIDSKTFYTMRTEALVKTDDGEKESTTTFDNYKKLDGGIVMPMKIMANGGEITFKSIEINKPVDEKIFVPTKG